MVSFFDSIFPSLSKMEHKIRGVEYVPPMLYQSADIVYEVKGDERGKTAREIKIPGMMVAELGWDEGIIKIKRAETYLDPSGLLGRIEEVKNRQGSEERNKKDANMESQFCE